MSYNKPNKCDQQFELELSFHKQFAENLLTVIFAVICSMTYGFRRDQAVNSNIRRKYGLIAEKGEKNTNTVVTLLAVWIYVLCIFRRKIKEKSEQAKELRNNTEPNSK